jgi:pilus assembly protein Flp/PilA
MRKQISALVKSFARDERGATLIEYAILVGLISAAIVGLIVTMSGSINTIFTNIAAHLTSAASNSN